VIAVDTNILVYAHRRDHEWHEHARQCVTRLAEGSARWAIPWPCIHEFYAVVTRPGIFEKPSTPAQGLSQIDAWLDSPMLEMLSESEVHRVTLHRLVSASKIRGGAIHDARIAAICIDHRVDELWTADRDFVRFSSLRCRNPLV
jgi:toxin-antitoxin system PIN domain toxin